MFNPRNLKYLAALLGLAFGTPHVFPGPPLSLTDDPTILNPHSWEIIVGIASAETDAIETGSVPAFEVTFGASENHQFTFATSRESVKRPDEKQHNGLGYGTLEWKWKLHQGERFALAFKPAYSVPLNHNSTVRGIIQDVQFLDVPLIAGYSTNRWNLNAQLGHLFFSDNEDLWAYGVSAGLRVCAPLELLVEIYGASDRKYADADINWTLGGAWSLNDLVSAYLSYGSKIHSDISTPDHLNHAFYFGIGWSR